MRPAGFIVGQQVLVCKRNKEPRQLIREEGFEEKKCTFWIKKKILKTV